METFADKVAFFSLVPFSIDFLSGACYPFIIEVLCNFDHGTLCKMESLEKTQTFSWRTQPNKLCYKRAAGVSPNNIYKQKVS